MAGNQCSQLGFQHASMAKAIVDQSRGYHLQLTLLLGHNPQQSQAVVCCPSLRDGCLAGRERLAKRGRQVVLAFFHVVSLSKPNMPA